MKKVLWIVLVFGLLSLVACSSTPKPKQVFLSAQDIVWDPPLIEAQVGQELTLTIRNDGALDHNFVSDELGLDILISPGTSETVTFVVTEPGKLEFICNIPGHEEAGMVGEIVVGE